MPIDPNIPLQVPKPVNPLTQMGEYADMANKLQQNKLLQQSYQKGQIDIQRGQIGLQQDQQNQSTQGSNRIAQQTAALLIKPDLSSDDVVSAINSEVQQGSVPQQVANTWLQNVQAVGNDPGKLRTMLTAHLVGTLSGPEAVKSVFGVNTEQSNGAQTLSGVTRSPVMGGGFVPSTATTQQLSPGQKATMVPTVNSQGQPGTVPLGGLVTPTGDAPPLGNGRYPAQGASAAPPGPPGFNPTGLPPGEQESRVNAANAAAGAGSSLYAQADAAKTQKAQLDNMAADLAHMQATGPGTQRLAMANAIAQKYAGVGLTMNADELSSTENFAKVAKQIAMQQAGTLGAGTDEKLNTALGSNPNLDLSKLGNTQIIAMLKGNADAITAKAQAWDQWQKQGHAPGSYNDFQTQFNKTFDPRAYQWNYLSQTMTPQQRQSYLNALPDKGAGLRNSYNQAVSDGLLQPPGQ